MQGFVDLIERLDRSVGTSERVEAMAAYFAAADPADAAWALQVLLAKRRRRLITGRRLRQICLEGCGLPEWLFDACHSQVGDSAETIALLWPATPSPSPAIEAPLSHWMETRLPAAAALEGDEQARAVRLLWQGLKPQHLFVANKLLTGGLRVGVAQGLVVRALARLTGLDDALLQHRLMGEFIPSSDAWRALLAPADDGQVVASRPYPFFLASPLESDPQAEAPLRGPATAWLAEWKWDGIRGQLIRRAGQAFLWSRGEELLNEAFPDLIEAAAALPDGLVIDGEILVWHASADQPAPFAALQRRLGRKRPGSSLLRDCPAVLVAYDLLEWQGRDIRDQPLSQRRDALESLHDQVMAATDSSAAGLLRLSPRLALESWEQLEPLRQRAAAAAAEGVMLKALESPYLIGRKRGHWWKHKREPYRLDAVLLYAQAGSGRRANLFTDYTFGLWDRPLDPEPGTTPSMATDRSGGQESESLERPPSPRLVTFAKAYSGLDDAEILALDRWIRSHTTQRFGPVRMVEPVQVFELAFEGLQPSGRHKSGLAVRFPRISRWRRDKPAEEADTLAAALQLLEGGRTPVAAGLGW